MQLKFSGSIIDCNIARALKRDIDFMWLRMRVARLILILNSEKQIVGIA